MLVGERGNFFREKDNMYEDPKVVRNLMRLKNDRRSVCLQSNQQSDGRSKLAEVVCQNQLLDRTTLSV